MSDLETRPLTEGDAPDLSRLLTRDSADYQRYFEPFATDPLDMAAVLAAADQDRFWGVFTDGELAALVMLRGLDAGHAAPAFGIYVAERRSRMGIASHALEFAESWCRAHDRHEIMLTVHPENGIARGLYERRGFAATGERSSLGHLIYRKRLEEL